MTEIIAGIIGALGLILVAVLGAKLNGRVRTIQGQVQNDHPVNLRDELDARHKETRGWWWDTRRDIGGMRAEIRELRKDLAHERDRIDELEDTFNPKEKK